MRWQGRGSKQNDRGGDGKKMTVVSINKLTGRTATLVAEKQ